MRFTLQLTPVPKGRPRFTRAGHAFTPAKTRQFEREVALLLREQFRAPPFLGAVYCEAHFYMPKPKRCVRLFPSVRPDIDNLIKGVKDAANGILWVDDGQVVEIRAKKLYGLDPRIELEVFELLEAV